MAFTALVLTALVGLEHVYIFVLEAFLWETPYGRKTFGMTPERAAATSSLAKNQGLYNLFLAAGIGWSFLCAPDMALQLRIFFVGCVIVAAIVGSITANRSILVVQGAPALLAMAALMLSR
jgi:putative membrane protein